MNLTQRIRFAVYAFRHGLIPSGGLSMKVHSFDKNEKSVSDSLGITDERKKELIETATKCNDKNRYYSEGISEASEICNHPNELVFVIIFLEQSRSFHRNPLLHTISKLFGG